MSNQTQANPKPNIGGGDKSTDEKLLVLMIAAGIYAYEVYAKLDPKAHLAASFRHTFSVLAGKRRELLAKNPGVELLDAVVGATPKKAVKVECECKGVDTIEERPASRGSGMS